MTINNKTSHKYTYTFHEWFPFFCVCQCCSRNKYTLVLARFLNAVTVASHSLKLIEFWEQISINIMKTLPIILHIFSLYLWVSKGPYKPQPGQEFSTSTHTLLEMLENSQINLPAKLRNRILIYYPGVQLMSCFFLSFFQRGKHTCHKSKKSFANTQSLHKVKIPVFIGLLSQYVGFWNWAKFVVKCHL